MRNTSAIVSGILDNAYNKPREIYDLYLDGQTLHFVAHDENTDFFDPAGDPATYTALGISRGEIETSVDTKVDNVTIRLDNVNKAMSAYVADNELRGRKIIIRKIFTDISGSWTNADDVYLFNGIVNKPSLGEGVMEVECVSRAGTFEAEGPKRTYQLLCPWKFASSGCTDGLDATTLYATTNGEVDAGSTTTIILDSGRTEATDYWKYGQVEFTTGENDGVSRLITASASGTFTMNYALSSAPVENDDYEIKRGCDKTIARCSGLSNSAAFGGFFSIPFQMVIRG